MFGLEDLTVLLYWARYTLSEFRELKYVSIVTGYELHYLGIGARYTVMRRITTLPHIRRSSHKIILQYIIIKKCKVIPLQARCGPEGG